MASPFADYLPIIGRTEHDLVKRVADTLAGLRVVMVNSTRDGGGVAEILRNLVPLLNELGLDVKWEVIEGQREFFDATKTLHNALHGRPEALTPELERAYWETTAANVA